jgi:hypothetical protein
MAHTGNYLGGRTVLCAGGAAALAALCMAGCGQSAPLASASPTIVSGSAISGFPSNPGRTLTALPSSGPPGTLVTLRGYLPAMRTAKVGANNSYQYEGNIDFGGVSAGLYISVNAVHWSRTQPGHFTTTFRVPQVPWLTLEGSHPLSPGPYSVALTCVGNGAGRGCSRGPAEIQTNFTLTGGSRDQPSHAFLHFSPTAARPGQRVRVTGWAPLTTIIGKPFGYQLLWRQDGHTDTFGSVSQASSGRLSGSFLVPSSVNGIGPIHFGKGWVGLGYFFLSHPIPPSAQRTKTPDEAVLGLTPFRVMASPEWVHLNTSHPVRLASSVTGIALGGHPSVVLTTPSPPD